MDQDQSRKVAVSWSGGKDSSLALYKIRDKGVQISYLFNAINKEGTRSRSHGLDPELIRAQAKAARIPIFQIKTSNRTYESDFKDALRVLKGYGIEGMVFGDIDLEPHREWIERVCGELGIEPILPLWGLKRDELIDELVGAGFEAVIVAVKAEVLGEEWLGRKVTKEFIHELLKKDTGIDLCGELGEFHTLVTDAPMFLAKIEIQHTRKVLREGYRFLEILSYKMSPKDR
jgi:uncharacterized protein (TIGR00290 family)